MKKKLISVFIFILIIATAVAAWSAGTQKGISTSDMFLLSFGKGKVQIKFYSDYFCGACKNLEPDIEHLLADLTKRDIITITFVDVPMHKNSAMYARYFLYILNDKKEITRALKARSALFEAAQKGITDKEKLEEFLTKKGFRFKEFDAKPVFTVLTGYLREDKIIATPTCVVSKNNKNESYQGVDSIRKMIEGLK